LAARSPTFLKDTAGESGVIPVQNPKSHPHHRMVRLIEQSPPAWAKFFQDRLLACGRYVGYARKLFGSTLRGPTYHLTAASVKEVGDLMLHVRLITYYSPPILIFVSKTSVPLKLMPTKVAPLTSLEYK
jgi:hypothetical protein